MTESFPPKSELHSDRRSSILLGMSSEVALIPAAGEKMKQNCCVEDKGDAMQQKYLSSHKREKKKCSMSLKQKKDIFLEYTA